MQLEERIMKIKYFGLLLGLCLTAGNVIADEIRWPSLPPDSGFSGRIAMDSDKPFGHNAPVFVMSLKPGEVALPIPILIPQFAFYKDQDGTVKIPVLIVQAETNGKKTAIGYKNIDSQGAILWDGANVSKLEDFELLGANPQKVYRPVNYHLVNKAITKK